MSETLGKTELPPAQSPFRETMRMFLRNYAAVVGLLILLMIVITALVGPYVYPNDPFDMVWTPLAPPGEEGFWFGTDYLGRDLLAGVIFGG